MGVGAGDEDGNADAEGAARVKHFETPGMGVY
jgi:hypothetical protein